MEPFYPLRVDGLCAAAFSSSCRPTSRRRTIFAEYAYFSSYSDSWLEHARAIRRAMMRRALGLGADSLVVELGSNDGYLLRNFVAAGDPGPRASSRPQNVARSPRPRASPTLARFFGLDLAQELRANGRPADLIACNNTLAQVPDLNDFVAGIAELLAPTACSRSRSRTSCASSRRTSSTRSTTSTSRTSRWRPCDRILAAPRPGGRGRRRAADPRRFAARPRPPRRIRGRRAGGSTR